MPIFKVIYKDKNPNYQNGAKYKDDDALHCVENYIARCRNQYEVITGGFGINLNHAVQDMENLAIAYGKYSGLRLRHSVLSFSDEEISQMGRTKAEQLAVLKRIAWYSAAYYGSDYQVLYGIHQEPGHYHIHFLMSVINFNTGLKYAGKKSDYRRYEVYLNRFFRVYFGWRVIFVSDMSPLD